MKGKLADLAFELGLFKPFAFLARGRGAILMLHEVHAGPDLARFDGTTAGELDHILTALRRWDVDLIAMDDFLPRLRSDNPRHFVVITLDDGYRDNFTNALPVLERHKAPALINVPTQAVTRDLYCWWLALRTLFIERDRVQVEPMGRTFDTGNPEA
jgi:hypothetical protein